MFNILFFKKSISKSFISRLNFELVMHMQSLMKKDTLFRSSLTFNKIWVYIFQLESIRSARFEKLLLTKDDKNLLVRQFLGNVKLYKMVPYHQYLFSFFIFKMQLVLQDSISSFPLCINTSVLSVDLYLNKFFLEYKKRLFLFYNDFYFYGKLIFPKIYLQSKTFSLNFRQNKNIGEVFFPFVDKEVLFLEVFVSVQYCINKLTELGFFHKFKFRSVGNSKLIKFDDNFIIKQFSLVAFNFLNWFRCCRNFFFIKRLIFFIRESCFLTLCRKHNKHKNWVYKIYTKDLNLIYTFNLSSTFFPSIFILGKLKRKFYFFSEKLLVDESFFLS